MTTKPQTQNDQNTVLTLNRRVEQLEHRCRNLKKVLIGMTAGVAVVVLVAAAPPARDALQTKSLEVVDDDGNVRIRIGQADEGYGVVVFDAKGEFQATLTDAPLGAVMQLRKDGGGIELMATGEGAGMSIRDRNGKPRALVVHQKGGSGITLKDQEGDTVFSAPK